MERRVLVFKSAQSKLDKGFLDTIEEKYIQCIQTCSLGSAESSVLTGEDIYCSCAPDPWTRLTSVADIKNKIKTNKTFTDKKNGGELGEILHNLLDSLSTPGRSLLSLVWVCDKVPGEPTDILYSALHRAVSWHGGHITIITPSSYTKHPDWVFDLGVEALPVSDLCDGLSELVCPTLVWRGNLVLTDQHLTRTHIEGYELHFQRDHLDLVLQKIGLTKLDSKKERTASKLKYFGYNLELMTAVDTLSVPASVLTSHHFQLTTPLLEDDGLSEYLLEAGFQGSRLGYIARLRVADSIDPKAVRNKINWNKQIIDGTIPEVEDESYLGDSLDALHFLIYEDSLEATFSTRSVLQKSAILLRSSAELSSGLLTGAWKVQDSGGRSEDALFSVPQLNIESEISTLALYAYKRNVCAKVLELLLEERNDLVSRLDKEELVTSVDAALQEVWLLVEDSTSVNSEHQSGNKLVNVAPEDTAARRIFAKEKLEKETEIKAQVEKKLEKKRRDTISLEAKEIVKYFDASSGGASTTLDLENINQSLDPEHKLPSHKQYSKLFKEHYEKVDEYKGFSYNRYKFGKDFKEFESTKYNDVYYFNGPQAERQDYEFKRKRDRFIGMSKETSTTLDAEKVPFKLKISSKDSTGGSKAGSTAGSRRSSPRKKIGKTASPRAGSVSGASDSQVVAKRNHLAKAAESHGRRNLRGKPESGGGMKGSSLGVKSQSTEEVRKKKLRVAVMTALMEKGIRETNPIFRKSFSTLFKMCQVLGIPQSGGSKTSDLMLNVARSNVDNVINIQRINMKK